MDAVKPYKILYHHRIASKDGQYVHVEEIIKATEGKLIVEGEIPEMILD